MKNNHTITISAALLAATMTTAAYGDASHQTKSGHTSSGSAILDAPIGDYVAPADAAASHKAAPSGEKAAAPANTATTFASKFYRGAGSGIASIDLEDQDESFEDANIRAFMGFQLNQYFAVEAGMNTLPFDELLGTAHITGMDISLLASLPVTSRFSAYGRVGRWKWDVSVPYYGTYYELLGGTDTLYGIGLEYKISPKLKFRLEATRYEATDVSGVAEIDTITSNVVYSF